MNSEQPAKGGRFKGVRYFNGGLFSTVSPVELRKSELELIGGKSGASTKDWSKINPAIFGTLFQHSMDKAERHALGAHFTSEADIQRIVGITIVEPWQAKIDSARTISDLFAVRRELMSYRVLDPACGSGNFLYVSFRELSRLDLRILTKLQKLIPKQFAARAKPYAVISPKQFFGIDIDPFGVELAKVTLMLAKKLALDHAVSILGIDQEEMALGGSDALPLDNLDDNIVCDDALFCAWPKVDAIVGNPPYQSKNKMQKEMDLEYINRLRKAYPDIDGRADYCVYWFRKAHDELKNQQRAGLVGTNTIRQNYSREGGTDYIVANGGTILDSVSSMAWSGEANVHVSIVNWIKGDHPGPKRLYVQEGNNPDDGWTHVDLEKIGPSLSFSLDVTQAKRIEKNAKEGKCFQGQTHGHKGFLLSPNEAKHLIRTDATYKKVLFPFLIADDLIGEKDARPTRYVIDFQGMDVVEASKYSEVFDRIKKSVLPDRQKAADQEAARNAKVLEEDPKARVNLHHANFLRKWWIMSYAREEMVKEIEKLSRYVVCGQVTKRPVFEFISPDIRPNAACVVFAHEDDYSFGILQSGIHWEWFVNRCSTLTERFRYTSNTVFDSFPWPQRPTLAAVKDVSLAAVEVRKVRNELRKKHRLSFRELYRLMEVPGENPLKVVHGKLDAAVREAYGMTKADNVLSRLLRLNSEVAEAEAKGLIVVGPGFPTQLGNIDKFVSDDFLTS